MEPEIDNEFERTRLTVGELGYVMVAETGAQVPTLIVIRTLLMISPVSAVLLTLKVMTLSTLPKLISRVVQGYEQAGSK